MCTSGHRLHGGLISLPMLFPEQLNIDYCDAFSLQNIHHRVQPV